MLNSRSSFTRWKTTILTLLLACACCALSTRPAIAQPAPPAPVLLSAAPTPLRVPLPQETLTIGESYRIGFDAPSVPPPDGLVYRYRIYIGDTVVVPNAQAGPQGNEMPAPTARGTLAIRASIRYVIVDQSKWEPS